MCSRPAVVWCFEKVQLFFVRYNGRYLISPNNTDTTWSGLSFDGVYDADNEWFKVYDFPAEFQKDIYQHCISNLEKDDNGQSSPLWESKMVKYAANELYNLGNWDSAKMLYEIGYAHVEECTGDANERKEITKVRSQLANNISAVCVKKKNWKSAIVWCDIALQLDPTYQKCKDRKRFSKSKMAKP